MTTVGPTYPTPWCVIAEIDIRCKHWVINAEGRTRDEAEQRLEKRIKEPFSGN